MLSTHDVVPYPGSAHPQAHINRMAVMAILHDMVPPNLTKCHVLELGCGDGSHLLPMAIQFPESQFVGIDINELAIARATDLAQALHLDNVTFRVSDVEQLSGKP